MDARKEVASSPPPSLSLYFGILAASQFLYSSSIIMCGVVAMPNR